MSVLCTLIIKINTKLHNENNDCSGIKPIKYARTRVLNNTKKRKKRFGLSLGNARQLAHSSEH